MATTAIVQEQRLLKLATPLEPDVLLLESVTGSSAISSLYSYEFQMLADRQRNNNAKVKPEELVGSSFAAIVELHDGSRCINGIVKEFIEGDSDERFIHYSAEIVPAMWLLTLQSDCRVFQDVTTPDIIEQVLQKLQSAYPDLVSYETHFQRTYHKWDCCLQYRETHFNFLSRLMEHEGIFYFFRHEVSGSSGKHTLVIADSVAAFRDLEPEKTFKLDTQKGYGEREDTVASLSQHVWLQPGKTTVRDHHFELPSKTLESSQTVTKPIAGNTGLEIYDYPGDFAHYFNKPGERLDKVNDHGDGIAATRSQEEEFSSRLFSGASNCRGFVPGFRIQVDARDSDLSKQYVLLSVEETVLQSPSYVSDQAESGGYNNRFTCVPFGTVYRPRRVTPKPLISGPQTAVVTVKKNEESWLDKYGRVRVQFHWDRLGESNEKSTCWVRVAQPWAGARWGAHFWPRVGQEVVVEFLEGDPDRPLVTGSVYNAANMPPYELPANYTRSGVITRSSKTGGSANFNEVRFEDKKGAEQLFLHAEMDMDQSVEHDSRESIGNDFHLAIGSNQTESVGKEKHTSVGADVFEDYGKNVHTNIGSNEVHNVGASSNLPVGGNDNIEIGGNLSTDVGGDIMTNVGKNYSLTVGMNHDEKASMNFALEAGMVMHLKAGMNLVIESGAQLTVKCGSSFIMMTPASMSISAPMVMINSGGAAGAGPGAKPKKPSKPDKPTKPNPPDKADDGSKGTKLN